MSKENKIKILYCKQCNWLLRSAWIAQELLSTFDNELSEVSLLPGTGGVFEITVNDSLIWSLKEKGRFPNIKELKQLVRDLIDPDKNLGHIDR